MYSFKNKYNNLNNTILFTNARDEIHIKEWCLHHLSLGFDKIVIFDHLSKLPLIDVLLNFSSKIEVININKKDEIKFYCMNKATTIARKYKAEWMLYIDADEFLIMNDYNTINELINDYSILKADCIFINWCLFGTNYHIKEPDGLLFDNYTRCNNVLHSHVKSLVKVNKIKDIISPHVWNLLPNSKTYLADKSIVNKIEAYGHNYYIEYFKAPFYLAHYINQSEETYINRKINRPTDDSVTYRTYDKKIHDNYNNDINTTIRDKYSENLKSLLIAKEKDRYLDNKLI